MKYMFSVGDGRQCGEEALSDTSGHLSDLAFGLITPAPDVHTVTMGTQGTPV